MRLALLATVLLGLPFACSTSEDADGGEGEGEGEVDEVTHSVGPAGATIVSGDGVLTLVIPEGALADPVDIGIRPIAPGDRSAALVERGADYTYRLSPDGLVFAAPVAVRVRGDETPSAEAGVAAGSIQLFGLESADGAVEELEVTGVHVTEQEVVWTTELRHFSTFGRLKTLGTRHDLVSGRIEHLDVLAVGDEGRLRIHLQPIDEGLRFTAGLVVQAHDDLRDLVVGIGDSPLRVSGFDAEGTTVLGTVGALFFPNDITDFRSTSCRRQQADGRFGIYVGLDNPAGTVLDGSAIRRMDFVGLLPIDCRNGPPVAVDDQYGAQVNETLSIPAPGLLGNDTDPDDPIHVSRITTPPTHGELLHAPDGSFQYTLNGNYDDGFDYEVCDSEDACDEGHVTILGGQAPFPGFLGRWIIAYHSNDGVWTCPDTPQGNEMFTWPGGEVGPLDGGCTAADGTDFAAGTRTWTGQGTELLVRSCDCLPRAIEIGSCYNYEMRLHWDGELGRWSGTEGNTNDATEDNIACAWGPEPVDFAGECITSCWAPEQTCNGIVVQSPAHQDCTWACDGVCAECDSHPNEWEAAVVPTCY